MIPRSIPMLTLLGVLLIGTASCASAANDRNTTPLEATSPPVEGQAAHVTHVSDGDSFVAEIAGAEERVRMIGINSPERGECFGDESRQILSDLIEDETVVLVADVEATDQYGRILAYVYHDDQFVNEVLAFSGAALARAYEPNVALQTLLDAAEVDAVSNERGMWSPDACGGDEVPSVAVTEVVADAPGRDNENLNGEFVTIANHSNDPVSLGSWTIKDESSVHRYTFPPDVDLQPGGTLTLFTGCGDDGPDQRYWCSDGPVWDNQGDTAFLMDEVGSVRHRFSY